ncbi:MAG: DNA polymerase III subunit alpha, partial [Oscillospiraceae bacterium]|nr:DNA polymerase III subunit alpha [Oscillospiraceae bacterium]
GLVAIKNIGRGLIARMMAERDRGGPFTDFQDFCKRMDGVDMNKRAVENLIRAGAFDSMGARRSQLIAVYEKVMDGISAGNRVNLEGQIDFFGMGNSAVSQPALVLPDIPEYSAQELMAMEKEVTGLYLSGHPMDAFRNAARARGAVPIGRIREDFAREDGPQTFADEQKVTLAGVVTSSKTKTTKKNTLMAYVTLEDDTGAMEMLCFARALENYGSYLREGQVICASGRLSVRDEKAPQLMCDTAYPLEAGGEAPPSQPSAEAAPASALAKKTLYLRLPSMDSEEMAHVRRVLFMFEGRENPVKIRLADTGKLLGTTCTLLDSLVREMRETLGEENVVVK